MQTFNFLFVTLPSHLSCSISYLLYKFLTNFFLNTVIEAGTKHPGFSCHMAKPWKAQIIFNQPAVFCIIHVAERMHMTQQLIWPLFPCSQ